MKTEFASPFYTQPSKHCKTDQVFIDPIPCIHFEEVVEDEEHLEVQVENQAGPPYEDSRYWLGIECPEEIMEQWQPLVKTCNWDPNKLITYSLF